MLKCHNKFILAENITMLFISSNDCTFNLRLKSRKYRLQSIYVYGKKKYIYERNKYEKKFGLSKTNYTSLMPENILTWLN